MILSSPSQAWMDSVLGAFRFLHSGVHSNWWGFGCPLHCGTPVWGTLAACFLGGLITGWFTAISLAIWIFGRGKLLTSSSFHAIPQVLRE